jgi:hypothetical protein
VWRGRKGGERKPMIRISKTKEYEAQMYGPKIKNRTKLQC